MKLKEIITDDSKKLSMSRFLIVLLITCYQLFAGYIVFKTNTLPDIPLQVAALIAALYGVNKLSATMPFNGEDNK